ncbi:unnamed protein product [Taenia asiatica]|uniref:DUF718 domain-containing protein n=1 Tax=Taenia asiatica TaxID=60517 RepID=A0A0R3VZA2_TAEAS|nr:unnamed protein product [Taenia asiatica]
MMKFSLNVSTKRSPSERVRRYAAKSSDATEVLGLCELASQTRRFVQGAFTVLSGGIYKALDDLGIPLTDE